jgi:transglutaminase-like putative cysteine protease
MTNIRVHSELHYTIQRTSSFIFAILAGNSTYQTVLGERVTLEPSLPFERLAIDTGHHEILRVTVPPGPFSLTYDANVRLDARIATENPSSETPFADLPAEVLGLLNPSRYCESDKLDRFVDRTFGTIPPGFERVTGICNWIYDHLSYIAGSTDSSTTAVDVLVRAAGVCRDYAHLGIALCRALGIPARYVSGYAVGLDPPDFHGFFEAFLDGRWYLFDATRMAPIDKLVRIAAGRDAADAPFATFVGAATLDTMVVSAAEYDDAAEGESTTAPVSTA